MFETRQKLVIKEGSVHFSAPNNSLLYFVTYTWYLKKNNTETEFETWLFHGHGSEDDDSGY
jgi:hypothetical protein